MAESDASRSRASFWTQADALLRKNLTYQKRNAKTNCRLISFPFILCVLLVLAQNLVNNQLDKDEFKCGCTCVDTNGDGKCEKVCGLQYSDAQQAAACPISSPPQWSPVLQVPAPEYRAVKTDFLPFNDLPNESCRLTGTCPVTVLVTGNNRTLGQSVAGNMFSSSSTLNISNVLDILANSVLGSDTETESNNYVEPAFMDGSPLYIVQSQCGTGSPFSLNTSVQSIDFQIEVRCVRGIHLWRNSASDINDEIYKGYYKGNSEEKINEIIAAYDFMNSDRNNLNVNIWYNSTPKNDGGGNAFHLLRVPRIVNLASNAYLRFLKGSSAGMQLQFVKEMPKSETNIRLDLASVLGTLFFTWVILQLFPVTLTSLVYEKQQRLRIMMKMHGLGDGPYWMISYAYFFAISLLYMFVFIAFGSVIGLKFFTLNDYSIQFVFYFIYINLQISVAFLVSTFFSNVKTATVVAYICVFGSGLLGGFFYQSFLEDTTFPRGLLILLEMYPGFSLYRGLYEFSQYAFIGDSTGTYGMRWENLNDNGNGMKEVFTIMTVEWIVVLFVAYYIDQVLSSGKSPLFFFKNCGKKPSASLRMPSLRRQGSKVFVNLEKPDVVQEREKVEQLLLEANTSHAIVCDNLRKVYPGRDGNQAKLAVKGLSLALPRGECFGMLGPNGAGKTSFISMMIGLTKPTLGTAYVQGLNIQTHMDYVYTNMGVCPQHDLLWETLTGREHLLFYGRLKNLKGSALTRLIY
ncbi:ABC transporter A family member 7 [Linum perenne]